MLLRTVLFLVFWLCALDPVSGAAPLYWVSFASESDGYPLFLMQIDQRGNVVIPPAKVIDASQIGSKKGATALSSQAEDRLILWALGGRTRLYKSIINKVTGHLLSVEELQAFAVDDDSLQTTQRKSRNFLVFEGPGNMIVALDAMNTAGNQLQLDRKLPGGNDEASISPDGRILVSNRHNFSPEQPQSDRLYVQRLSRSGKPEGAKRLVAVFQDIEAVDVTSRLADGKHFVVFVVDHGTNPDDQIFLQAVASDGRRSGQRIVINQTNKRNADDQNIAIEKQGRFLLFTVDGAPACAGKDILVYQQLTADGYPLGPLKPLVPCGVIDVSVANIDLLLEPGP